MPDGFEVTPEEIEKFAENLQALSEHMERSSEVLNAVRFDPLVFGIFGQFFRIGAEMHVNKAKDQLKNSAAKIASARELALQTAQTYRDTDQSNADTFNKG
ncbi:type VII secretion target [Goodfellowiella coeruleoviolacea]|uniref:Excreted virulence factor EspC, type VII ESX diderm n=1 Tax=Goodfellowiella coeruleoviolacea TaxID=334858 RepID=A0AAE3GC04_9PSEU|nr:type VII secretion target [Goodfellowiella coeruleoviolacea]MCP2165506.1 Excreted virulence factor EspC, type VII ESX diderm [Goodfellowiella coeruleoviolacea]